MTHIAIEIGDVGLDAASDFGSPEPSGIRRVDGLSPGFAYLDRSGLVVGEAGRAIARLRPRFVCHRYWDRLDESPVGRPFPRTVRHADLVHAHLSHRFDEVMRAVGGAPAEVGVLLVVPGDYTDAQLSLLLGIARASDIPVTGMVDASVAALEQGHGAERLLVLDVRMHRATWSLVAAGDRLSRERIESLEQSGLARLQENWVKLVAERFVQETRFDPFHLAEHEQALYDHLPDWLRRVDQEGSARLEMQASNRSPSVEITRAQLTRAAAAPLGAIVDRARELATDADKCRIVLTSRAATVPGLADRLATITGAAPIELGVGAAVLGALRRCSFIEAPGHELPFVRSLPETGGG